ncbi:MAG: hypothetical protein AAF086_01220 [Planctomycetota bacterium]
MSQDTPSIKSRRESWWVVIGMVFGIMTCAIGGMLLIIYAVISGRLTLSAAG